MAFMIHAQMNTTGDRQLIPSTITVVDGIATEVAADRIALYALDNVPTYRQLEIFTGWGFLYNGIRDRNLLDSQFAGSVLYSATNINKKGENDRRTASLLTSLTADDIVVGLGATVTGNIGGAINSLQSAFEKLAEAAKDRFFVAA